MSAFDEATSQGSSSSSLSERLLSGGERSSKQSQSERDYDDLLHLVKRFRFQSRCVLEAVDEYKRERTPFKRERLDQQAETARDAARAAADAFREKPSGKHDARRNKLRRDLQKETMAFDAVLAKLAALPPPVEVRGDIDAGRGGSFADDPEAGRGGGAHVIQLKQTLDLTDDASYEAHMAAEREREFRELASQARQVKDVYADLAGLVEEQKVSVDTIEEDAIKAHTRTMSGVNQVTQALRHQKSRTCFMKCVCVFAVVMTLVILFVLLMIKKR